MTSAPFIKLSAPAVAPTAALCELSPDARARIGAAVSPEAYVTGLIEARLYQDAARWMAQGLRPRESVWWSCLVARAVTPESAVADAAALTAAELWVFQPTEENRRAAMAAAEKTGMDTAAAWAAIAAFWSGGSMAPAEAAAVPPPAHLIGRAVSGAVTIAVLAKPPAMVEGAWRHVLAQAVDIARGGNGRAVSSLAGQ